MRPVELTAPAKLTTSLRIVGVRDDGMHLIDAEMVSLDLADTLVVSDGSGVTYSGRFAPDVEVGSDLVSRALKLVGRDVRVDVTKNIPAGGGLGGGSADAAAILSWAGFTDLVAVSRLGADIAFCQIGGRAKVSGIGETVESLGFKQQTFTLLLAPFPCNTADVYRSWDDLGGPVGSHGNDLEPAALSHEPRLGEWRDKLGNATGETPRLAGSGSTWFVEGEYPGDDRVVARSSSPR